MSTLSPEMTVLCNSVQYCIDTRVDAVWPHNDLDITKLNHLVRWHGLSGVVLPYLQSHLDKSDTLIIELKPFIYQQAIKQAAHLKQLGSLVSLFNEQNLDYVVFKGVAARVQFGETTKQLFRPSADIDVLLNPSDFPAAVNILIDNGYHCADADNALDIAAFSAHSPDKLCKRGLVFTHSNKHFVDIDVHWRVANTFSLPLSTSEILAQKQKTQVNGLDVLIPSFDHHFVLSAVHGYLDNFFQLKHLADLYFAMHQTSYDETKILSLADSLGVRNQVVDSVVLARSMFSDSKETKLSSSTYLDTTIQRYVSYNGFSPRANKGREHWTTWDKLLYLLRQIKTRSRKASLIEPIKNRFLLKFNQVPLRNASTN